MYREPKVSDEQELIFDKFLQSARWRIEEMREAHMFIIFNLKQKTKKSNDELGKTLAY